MALKIITDTTCDLALDLQDKLGITLLPLTVNFEEEVYLDRYELSSQDFFSKLVNAPTAPTTSQISPATFEQSFSKELSEGHEILGIFLSSSMSGTYQSAVLARQMLDPSRIHLVDSRQVTLGLALLVLEAVKLRDEGKNGLQIKEALEGLKDKVVFYAAVDTLEYLKRGGRISPMAAALGNLLNVKPIVKTYDGEITVAHKTRSLKKSLDWISDQMVQQMNINSPVVFGHAEVSEKMDGFIQQVQEKTGAKEYQVVHLGCTVGTHAGPGCIGAGFFIK